MASFGKENPAEVIDKKYLANYTEELKKRYVYSDLERQLFNLDLSAIELRKRARELERKSLFLKRKCRYLLKTFRHSEAWTTAKMALDGERRALYCNVLSTRLKSLVKLVKNAVEVEPLMKRVLKELDVAVQASDEERTKELVSLLEEEYELGFEETIKFTEDVLRDEEITRFVVRLNQEEQILKRLKEENGSRFSAGHEIGSLCRVTSEPKVSQSCESIASSASAMMRTCRRINSQNRKNGNGRAKIIKMKIPAS